MVTAAIQERVKKNVEHYIQLANNHFNKKFPVPPIKYDVKGTNGGYHHLGVVHFNPILLMENLEDYFANTIPHEVAHHIDTLNGDNARPSQDFASFSAAILSGRRPRRAKRSVHGPSWEHIMRLFGVKDITRCHDYDVTNAQVKMKKKYEYKCGSCNQQFFVSSVLHNKIGRGQVRWCKKCGRTNGQLIYVQNLGQRTFAEAKKVSEARKLPLQPTFVPKAPVVVAIPGVTTQDRARKIYGMYSHLGRQVCIRKMVDIGIKETTASTYYQNFKSGK